MQSNILRPLMTTKVSIVYAAILEKQQTDSKNIYSGKTNDITSSRPACRRKWLPLHAYSIQHVGIIL